MNHVMMIKNGLVVRLAAFASALALAAILAACGGGSHSESGRFALTVKWPEPSRLVPAASNSIKAVLTRGTTTLGQQILVRPQQPPWTTTVTFDSITPGSVTLTATAFPAVNATGVAQATGSAPGTIVAGQTAQVTVSMASTIATLEVTPPTSTILPAETVQLTATPKDARGNVVLVRAGNITFASGAAGTAKVGQSTGLVTGVAGSATAATITATESESQKSGTASVTVAASAGGCTPGVVTGPGGLPISGWPKAGADVRNTGRGLGSGATGALKWAVSTGSDSGGFQVAVGPDGTLYNTTYGNTSVTPATPGTLTARNPADGSVKWTFSASGPSIVTIPTVGRNGLVYFADNVAFHAVDAPTGVERWTAGFSQFIMSPTIGLDGTVYIADDRTLQALDGDTGSVKWSADLSGPGLRGWYWTTPAIGADGTVYLGRHGDQGGLTAIDGKNGCTRWTALVGTVGGAAVGDDGTVYATASGSVVAVNPATGTVKWTANNVSTESTPPAIGQDGTVYVLGQGSTLTALNPAGGAVKWTFTAPNNGGNRASPAVGADGTVYILSSTSFSGSSLYAVNPANGTLKWAFDVPDKAGAALTADATPTIAPDGTIYVCTFGLAAGQVIAVR